MPPSRASPDTYRKIKAVLVLAIFSGSEGHRIRSDILFHKYFQSGSSTRNAQSVAHRRYDDGPKHSTVAVKSLQDALAIPKVQEHWNLLTEAIDAMLSTPKLREHARIASEHLKGILQNPGLQDHLQLLAEQVEAVASDPKVQERHKLNTEQMKKLMANQNLMEHAKLASEQLIAMMDDTRLRQQSKLFVEQLEALMMDPQFKDQNLKEHANVFSEKLKAIMEDPEFQKYSTLFTEHSRYILTHSEVQQHAKIASVQLKSITEDQDFVELAKQISEQVRAIVEHPVLQEHSKFFFEQIEGLMAEPKFKELASVAAEQVEAIMNVVAIQEYSPLFGKGLDAAVVDSSFPVQKKLKKIELLDDKPWSLAEVSELDQQKYSMARFIPVAGRALQRARARLGPFANAAKDKQHRIATIAQAEPAPSTGLGWPSLGSNMATQPMRSVAPSTRASLAVLTAAANEPTPPPAAVKSVFTNVVAGVMTAGALSMFAPVIWNILSAKSALGLSRTTWSLNLLGVSGVLAYNVHKGIPLANYIESIFLMAQSLLINALLLYYGMGLPAVRVVAAAAAYVATGALFLRQLPDRLFTPMQALATAVYSWALIPQIVGNFAAKTSGGWSPITAFLSMAGNAARIVTTLNVAKGEKMLLVQFLSGMLLNCVLLVQSLVWTA